ncbi:MAG: hypothetical protein WB586_03425 [Chthoniobacterales bacterium]
MHQVVCSGGVWRFGFLIWLLVAGPADAQNKYDVLAHMLRPYGALFYSRSPTKALQADVILTDGTDAFAALTNQPVRISLQMPDKLRLETVDPNRKVVLCRNGQHVWIYPPDLAERLIATAGSPGPQVRLPDFHLPLKDQEIALLAALFQIVRFESATDPRGRAAWSLDFRLAPELMQGLKHKDWLANALVRQTDFQLEQLAIRGSDWTGKLEILSSSFLPSLPVETFEAGPALSSGAKDIPSSLFGSALERLSTITVRGMLFRGQDTR